jgi:CheY-like chemotaxis protein
MGLRHSLGAIRMLMGEPNPQVRSSFRSALFRSGLRGIEDCSSALRSHELLTEQMFDLIVLDADMEDSDVLGLVRLLRENKLGKDPFTNVILIADPPLSERARSMVRAGADAILIRPVSVQVLEAKIGQLIEARRPFVVTQDYIGPERRTEARPEGMPIPQMPVPSNLRNRACGKTDDSTHLNAVAEAWSLIKRQRIERLIYQIGWLSRHIVPVGMEQDASAARPRVIQQLGLVSGILADWIADTKDENLYATCTQLKKNALSASGMQGVPDLSAILSFGSDSIKLQELWDRQVPTAAA